MKRADKGGQVERRGLWHDGEPLHTISPMKIETVWSADVSPDHKGGRKYIRQAKGGQSL